MSYWTPDTDHIREIYSQDATSEDHRKVYETEFDRWLNKHLAEEFGRGYALGWDEKKRDDKTINAILGHNAAHYRTSIPQHMWPKLPNIIALPDKPIIVTPLVTVRKINNMWVFKCSHCPDYSVSPYWKLIYSAADYHAHNHHR